MQTGLRDRADLVEECDDVDAPTLVAGDPVHDHLREFLTAVFLEEMAAAVDRGVRLTGTAWDRAIRRRAHGRCQRRRCGRTRSSDGVPRRFVVAWLPDHQWPVVQRPR